jgi:hypothetical protein
MQQAIDWAGGVRHQEGWWKFIFASTSRCIPLLPLKKKVYFQLTTDLNRLHFFETAKLKNSSNKYHIILTMSFGDKAVIPIH